jgi:phosphopantetheinyl transferase (holo-ACP synthase)
MSDGKSGDPHSLVKSWTTGSMWWYSWNDIRALQGKCNKNQKTTLTYCAVTIKKGVLKISLSLKEAQSLLGKGSNKNRQAIIPMYDEKAGDPHTLDKSWETGSMWWYNWPDIRVLQDKCNKNQKHSFTYCVVTIKGGVLKISSSLDEAQSLLVKGSSKNRQAIIPMSDGKAGDPHSLDKSWKTGSMWWHSWNDIKALQGECNKYQYAEDPSLKYCAVTMKRGVLKISSSLDEAQSLLVKGSSKNRQAIIPMSDGKAGDPHDLDKSWKTGSMWWYSWNDIRALQDKCNNN